MPANFSGLNGAKQAAQLQEVLRRIDGRGYKSYKELQGSWSFPTYVLFVDYVQGDPYANPSRCRVIIPPQHAAIPRHLYSTRIRRVSVCDFLTRTFGAAVAKQQHRARSGGWHGEKGGDIIVEKPEQFVIERSSIVVHDDGALEARFQVVLPARGRTVMGKAAHELFAVQLPCCVRQGLLYDNLDSEAVWRHVACIEDSETLRHMLSDLGLVAFVAEGSILPRRAGNSQEPMQSKTAVPFIVPPSLRVEVNLPHAGKVVGMGVYKGVTLICGGGFHGKSTLLEAIVVGIYNKIPGDGREFVVTDPTAVKIRSEDGRRTSCVDISPFISNLPQNKDTRNFSTLDASGSTSQATNIQEAIEVGATLLLLDEDTCAANFMTRDARMIKLLSSNHFSEPITPFVERVKSLARAGISTILVAGGSGAFFSEADHVIAMNGYKAEDVTERAHAIGANSSALDDGSEYSSKVSHQKYYYPPNRCLRMDHNKRRLDYSDRFKVRSLHEISYGDEKLDLSAVEQLIEVSQTRGISEILHIIHQRIISGEETLSETLNNLEAMMNAHGLDAISSIGPAGNLGRPRKFEIAAAINRLRSLPISQ